jgi:hypothetical protein
LPGRRKGTKRSQDNTATRDERADRWSVDPEPRVFRRNARRLSRADAAADEAHAGAEEQLPEPIGGRNRAGPPTFFPLTGGAGMSRPERSRNTTAAATDALKQDTGATTTGVRTRTESEEAVARRMMELLRAGADVRARKVRRLRAAVRVKAYENQLKLSIAVDRLLNQTMEADPQESAA